MIRKIGGHIAYAAGMVWRQWPICLASLIVVVGIFVAGTGHWLRGAFLMGCGIAGAGGLRLILPEARAGLLAVRSRAVDVAVMFGFGLTILALCLIVPPSK